MAFWLLTQSIEWPSGAARATASAAVAPPAPGMFSIMTGCPIDFDITSPMARPAISPRPPGPKPITILTVRDGNSCAAAGSVRPITTAHAESNFARRSTFISSQVFSFLPLDRRKRRGRHQLALLFDQIARFRVHLDVLEPLGILEQRRTLAVAILRVFIDPDVDVAVDVAGLADEPGERLAEMPFLMGKAVLLVERELLAQRPR